MVLAKNGNPLYKNTDVFPKTISRERWRFSQKILPDLDILNDNILVNGRQHTLLSALFTATGTASLI